MRVPSPQAEEMAAYIISLHQQTSVLDCPSGLIYQSAVLQDSYGMSPRQPPPPRSLCGFERSPTKSGVSVGASSYPLSFYLPSLLPIISLPIRITVCVCVCVRAPVRMRTCVCMCLRTCVFVIGLGDVLNAPTTHAVTAAAACVFL